MSALASAIQSLVNVRQTLVQRYSSAVITTEAILMYLFLYGPIVLLVALSFNSSRSVLVWEGFTTKWYRQLFSGEIFAQIDPSVAATALWNSIQIAVVSVVVALVFGTMLAITLDRHEFPGKRALRGLVYLPIIVPSVVTGISLLMFYQLVGQDLSIWTATAAHIMFNISFVTIVVFTRLQQFDRSIEEAAMDLGANELETFRYVTLPAIKPGLIAAALLAFTMSFDDFVITFFVIGNQNTLPIFFFSMVRQGVTPGVNVIATLILIGTVALVIGANRYQRVT
ncbi:ABC transporter permease [Haloferax sp. DFSO52]|uniref:ABC transporter permease n=1 Tax=Haloferax sp. DFSO52 TaxID=3388505 RepID=UPI003A84242E